MDRPHRRAVTRGISLTRQQFDQLRLGDRAAGNTRRARSTGASARRSGREFEAMVATSNDHYRRGGDAVITKCHPETGGVPGRMFFRSASDVDYIGVLANGRPIAFDAKAVKDHVSFSLDDARPHVRAKNQRQCQFLADFARCGGLAFFMVHSWELEGTWLLSDLDRLARFERVTLCERQRGREPVHLVPFVPDASIMDLARGRPPIPWLSLIDR